MKPVFNVLTAISETFWAISLVFVETCAASGYEIFAVFATTAGALATSVFVKPVFNVLTAISETFWAMSLVFVETCAASLYEVLAVFATTAGALATSVFVKPTFTVFNAIALSWLVFFAAPAVEIGLLASVVLSTFPREISPLANAAPFLKKVPLKSMSFEYTSRHRLPPDPISYV